MQIDQFIGRQIDDFTVQERIGRGGMATVYRAYQASANRQVALKMITLDGEAGQQEEFRRRFDQEARLVSALEHSNIVPVIKYGLISAEHAYLAMRLLRGGSLSGLLLAGPLPLDRAVDIFTQIGAALSYAHSRGVIHRDLKPSNILLGDSGEPYLTDFGLAKLVEQSADLTKSGHIVGTPTYMSPEQLRGEPIDQRSDVYSMGVVLFHMLTGKPPFDSSETNVVSVIYQHLEKAPPSPRSMNPHLPEQVEAVVLRSLLKDPGDRYQHIGDMVDELNRAAGRRVSTTTSPALRQYNPRSPVVITAPENSTATLAVLTPIATPITDSQAIADPATEARSRTALPPGEATRLNPILIILAIIGAIALVVALIVLVTNVLAQTTPVSVTPATTPIVLQRFTVTEDVQGTAEQATPTEAEIALAQATTGTSRFIAYLACTRDTEYHAAQAREMADFAAVYDLAYRVYDAGSEAYRQVTQIDAARTDGAALLIICPLDITLLHDSLSSAQQAGIPLIFFSSGIDNYGGVLLAGDDYQMGISAGRAVGELAPAIVGDDVRAFILDYPDLSVLVQRANGLRDGLQQVIPDAQIVGRNVGGTPENGEAAVRQALTDRVDFNVILSINDAGSYGAVTALEAARIDPTTVVIGSVDGETLAQRYIAEGRFIRASVVVPREEFSRTAIDAAVRLLAGATLPETLLVPPGAAVTADTLATEATTVP